eukprot:gene175-64_t
MSALDISGLPDREERVAARRRRAEARLRREKEEAEVLCSVFPRLRDVNHIRAEHWRRCRVIFSKNKKSKGKHKDAELGVEAQGLGQQEVSQATASLERLKDDTLAMLTDIRVRRDTEENERRVIEENARLDRYEALQIEAVSSGRKNAAVEMKWADLLYIDIPQDLHDQLLLQKEACASILEGKDRRIREFITELKNKDEEYQKMLKRHANDINDMLKKMREQYVSMQSGYETQLDKIETSYAQERMDLIKANKEEIEALFEKRMQMEETEFMEQRAEREKKFQQRIDDLRTQDADNYNKSKIALEKSIQGLEQHLESMGATYQHKHEANVRLDSRLSREKLDYNLNVLNERNREHAVIQSNYKSKLNRLRETLNNLVGKYQKLDAKFKQENQDLTDEYKRLTRQFKDLQQKYQHFATADEKKFREVWKMNETEANVLIAQVQECNRIIHEQQLGLNWEASKHDVGDEGMGEHGKAELPGGIAEAVSDSGTTTGKQIKLNGKYAPGKVKKVLDMVRDEGAYLLDMKTRDEIAAAPDQAQKDVIQVNAILKYVGVDSQEDVSLFYQGQDEDDETLYVDHDDVLRLLKEFIAEKETLRLQEVNPDLMKNKSKKSKESEAEGKMLRRIQERKFWEKLEASALPEMHKRVWKCLHKYLERYLKLLAHRSGLVDSAVDLQKQNEELKQLLDQYLGSKVNEELQIPPTHVIRVVANNAA